MTWRRGLEPARADSRASVMFDRTSSDSNSWTRWKVRPSPSRARCDGLAWVTSVPCRVIRPADGFTRPEHTLKMLVLPAPFGPTRPVIMPALTARVTLSTASAPPYLMVRPSTERLVEPGGRGDRAASTRAGLAVSAGAPAGWAAASRAAALARRGGWVL